MDGGIADTCLNKNTEQFRRRCRLVFTVVVARDVCMFIFFGPLITFVSCPRCFKEVLD